MKEKKLKIWDGYKKNEKILISNILEKASRFERTNQTQSSNFLNPYEFSLVQKELDDRKISYQVIEKSPMCSEKVIMFGEGSSPVTVYRGVFKEKITHSDILGTLFSIGYEHGLIGDIFVEDGYFYLTNLTRMNSFLEENLYKIKNQLITLERVETIDLKKNHYQVLHLTISSYRLDHFVSLLSKKSRSLSIEILKRGDVLLNYQEIHRGEIQLKEGDVLSIRHVGKFRLMEEETQTKKGKRIVEVWKYL